MRCIAVRRISILTNAFRKVYMKYTLTRKLDNQTLACFFDDAWNAEVSSDVETLYSLFQQIWENIDEDPDFNEYEESEKAQLLRYYGYFLSHYGKAKSIPFYQERSKNLLTEAISLFHSLNQTEKALEAQIILGLCYFYEGAISESETVFECLLDHFEGNHLHPLYLRTCLNYTLVLQWKGEFQKALEIISEIKIPMEFCQDLRSLIIYHTQAGLTYRGIEQFDQAVYHYNKCIEISQEKNNWLVVGKNHNNLAFLYKILGKFDLAHHHVEQAIKIFRAMNHIGWMAHIIDTKAVIYLEENKFESALETIDESIRAFQQGDDFAGLTDALWNKTKSLMGLNRKTEAFEVFAELCQIAQTRIGQFAVTRYSKLFAEIVHIKQNGSLPEEVGRYKKARIIDALHRFKYNFSNAAQFLGFVNAKDLTQVLDSEFPRIFDELGINKVVSIPEVKEIAEQNNSKPEKRSSRKITKIELRETKISFPETNHSFSDKNIETFYLSAEKIAGQIDVSEDIILAVAAGETSVGDFVLAERQDRREYLFGQISHDASLDIKYLLSDEEPFPLDEIRILGKAAGFCRFVEADAEILRFAALPALPG